MCSGTPTINEAQAHLGQCPLGSRISYLNQDPSEYLDALPEATRAFDFIVFGHSIWFFPTPVILPVMLAKARRYARSVLVAEFSYSTKSPLAFPHILAAQYNNTLESTIQRGIWNIRCALTPPQICRLVEQAGWVKKEEQIVTQSAVLRDAWREVYMILRSKVFRRELDEAKISMGLKTVLSGMRDAVAASVQSLEGGLDAVRNMDVWVARFDEADTV